jgi:hypothetical protein
LLVVCQYKYTIHEVKQLFIENGWAGLDPEGCHYWQNNETGSVISAH